ncbi:MAG: DNA polymerase I [Desulfobacteraceae bacterium]|nr:DNA polymerase I [Desulfobacteraceae bacterium]
MTKKTIYIVDGTAYIYRNYHAIKNLSTKEGIPTNAIFGFTRTLINLLNEKQPQYISVCFDAKGKTFRNEIYDKYKANRPPMPQDLALQIDGVKNTVSAFSIPWFEKEGFEADDLIGTMAKTAQEKGFKTVIVTGDKDLSQLISEDISIYDPMKKAEITLESFVDENGFAPSLLPDAMGLAGDSADNIPGVKGVGMKTAAKLIAEYETLEEIYKNLDKIKGKKLIENLEENRENAFLSRKLAEINCSVSFDFELEDLVKKEPQREILAQLFKEYEFKNLQKEFLDQTDEFKNSFKTLHEKDEIKKIAEKIKKTSFFVFDTETTSINPVEAELAGISLSFSETDTYYIPVKHHNVKTVPLNDLKEALGDIFQDEKILKIAQNLKYDLIVLKNHGIDIKGKTFDTMLAAYLLSPGSRSHGLSDLALEYLNHKMIEFDEVVEKGKTFDQSDFEKAYVYACEDSHITLRLYNILEKGLKEKKLLKLLQEIEMPLVPVLADMEMEGIFVDKDKLVEMSKNFGHELELIEKDAFKSAGQEFNMNSSKQLGEILFEKLNLPTQKKTKKKTGYSTDMSVLEELSKIHPLPELILRHRELSKLKSTYTDALVALINKNTGRIHTSFNQTITATGRLSSSNPNLQNIPIRTEKGRKIREAFIPKQGWILLSADYSQIELRLLAHFSKDPILLEAFKNNEDIHSRTAEEVFQTLPGMINDDLRRQAKAINFGIIYGMGAFKLANELGISRKMAQTYIDNYYSRYKKVFEFIESAKDEARQTGYATTISGRTRHIDEINSSNKNKIMMAERIAVNTKIQGSAADILKLSMIKTADLLKQKKMDTKLLLTVHDELVFELPSDEKNEVMEILKTSMEKIVALDVPLKINIASGKNWSEAH